MRIIGVDLHTRQQSLAMLNTETGEVIERTLKHDNEELRKFYDAVLSAWGLKLPDRCIGSCS